MKRQILNPMLCAALSLTLFMACQSQKSADDGKVHVTADAATMDAEQLALAGEQLIQPHTFMLADKVFEMALAKDPKNSRALLYRGLIKPLMSLKGILTRIRPIEKKKPNRIEDYDKWVNAIPNSSLKDFLLDGKEDVATASDLQKVLVVYNEGLIDFYHLLKDTEAETLVLNVNAIMFGHDLLQSTSNYCTVKESTARRVDIDCDYSGILQRKLSSADKIVLRQMVAGHILYNLIYTSYTLDGLEEFSDIAKANPQMTQSELVALFDQSKGLGKLNSGHKFGLLREFGADLSSAWKFMVQNQLKMCLGEAQPDWRREDWRRRDYYEEHITRRKGFLFDNGFCTRDVRSETAKYLGMIDDALNGPISISIDNYRATVVTQVDAFILSKKPIVDLRQILPTGFNKCGNPIGFRDKTLGGILPLGDADTVYGKPMDQYCYVPPRVVYGQWPPQADNSTQSGLDNSAEIATDNNVDVQAQQ